MNKVKLNLHSRGRFSGKNLFFHSDTLFSALINCYVLLYGSDEITAFINHLHISSLFLGIEINGRDLDFYPLPLFKIKFKNRKKNRSIITEIKKIKKIRFISKAMFEYILTQFDGDVSEIDESLYCKVMEGFYALKEEWDIPFALSGDMAISVISSHQGNIIDRLTDEAGNTFVRDERELREVIFKYNNENYHIKPYFFFLTTNHPDNEKIKAVLNLFCEEGIGGKRSQGLGCFNNWCFSAYTFSEKVYSHHINLSLVYPQEGEALDAKCYNLVQRGGFIYRECALSYKKSEIQMFGEGSYFSQFIKGTLFHEKIHAVGTIYQYGKAFFLRGD